MSGVMPLASHSLSQDPSEMTPINPRQGSPASPPPQSETPVSNGHDSPSPTPQRKTYDLAVLNLPKPKRKIVSTFIGTRRTLTTLTPLEWAYLAISLVSLFTSFGFTVERIVTLRNEHTNLTRHDKDHDHKVDNVKADYTFAILLLWTTIFSIYHVIVGVISERACDLIVFMFTTVIVWIYVTINFFQQDKLILTKLIRFTMTSVVVPPTLVIGGMLCKQYFTSRKLIFYTVGGNEQQQEMFFLLLIQDSLLKFDVQMGGSVLILWVQNSFINPHVDLNEVIVIAVGIVVTVVWAIQAYLAIRLENKYLVYSFYASSWLEPAAVIANLVRVPLLQHFSKSLIYSAYAVGIIALGSRILSIYSMHLVSQNFGKGLKAKIFKISSEGDAPPAEVQN